MVHSGALDDRLGAYIILDLLPKLGINVDVLLTVGEEQGRSTANFFAPLGDPRHFSGGDLNSGLMTPHSSYTVTFTKAGEFDYICALHDYMGMVGTVVVRK